VYYRRSHINDVPAIGVAVFPLSPKYCKALVCCKVLDMAQQALEMGIAGNGANDKKIGPTVQFPQIERYHFPAPVFFQEAANCFNLLNFR
jgi:hypothetical protein